MSDRLTAKRVWGLFAELLEYPLESPVERLRDCRTLTGAISPDAETRLGEFQAFAEDATVGRLQEEYTRAFDMDESHSLYVGYHLLGESYKRSALLLEFKERYRAHGMEVTGELADHLPVILRFLAVCDDHDLTNEIVAEAMWPTLEMMARKDKKSHDAARDEDRPPTVARPYLELLAALLLVVRASPMSDGQPLALAGAVGWSTT